MLFEKKIKRVVDVEKAEKELEERPDVIELEKKDGPAMLIAALIVFVPAFLLVIGFFLFVIWLFFGRWL